MLLYPSIYEGFGLPVVEAMASGCPVFAGNFSSIPEVSGGNCHLCNTKDFDESFDLVSKILKDDIKLNFYKDTAKKFAQKYKWKNIIKQYELLYESIL